MSHHILVERPHPACILPLTHPFRADTLRRAINVAETFASHAPVKRETAERMLAMEPAKEIAA